MIELKVPTSCGYIDGVLHETGQPVGAALIICHGFRGSKDGGGRAVRLAEQVAAQGVRVLRFDFTPATTLSRQIEELSEVVGFIRQNIENRILLLGRSMGGSAALVYTAKNTGIAGLGLWAAPWGLAETFRLALGNLYAKLEQGQTVTINDEYGETIITPDFIQDFQKYDLLDCVRHLPDIPLLQVHGDKDPIVPISQAFQINQAASHLSHKELVVISGGDHHLAEHAGEAGGCVLNWVQNVINWNV